MNEIVRRWFTKATNDLNSAFLEFGRGPSANFDLICFLCQQGIEKLLKATLIARKVTVPRIHNLVELHRMLIAAEPRWNWDESELQFLSTGAVIYRYPGKEADQETAARAVELTRRLWDALTPMLD
jgi:HEPN domain-containing protein